MQRWHFEMLDEFVRERQAAIQREQALADLLRETQPHPNKARSRFMRKLSVVVVGGVLVVLWLAQLF